MCARKLRLGMAPALVLLSLSFYRIEEEIVGEELRKEPSGGFLQDRP